MPPQPRPDFPSWLERRIPLLAAARTNPAYRAFRERRDRNRWYRIGFSGWSGSRRRSPLGCAILLALGALMLVPVTLQSPFGSARQVALFGVLIVGALLVAIMWTRARAGHHVPYRIGAAFSSESMNAPLALDLWMCGVTGREIAEAIVLENLEGAVRSAIILQLIGSAIFLLVLFVPAPLEARIIYALTILAMGVLGFHVVLRSFPYGTQRSLLMPLLSRWRRSEDLWTKIQRELPRQLRELAVLFFTIVIGIILLSISVRLILGMAVVLPANIPHWVWVQALGVLLAGVVLAGSAILASLLRHREEQRLVRLLNDANEAFEIYIRCEVLKDPDARHKTSAPEGEEIPE